MKKLVVTAAAVLIVSNAAFAGEWSGNLEAGYLASQGNTKTSTANAAFAASYVQNKWTHSLKASANTSSASDATTGESNTTGERYTAGVKTALAISDFNYLYGTVDFDKDRFGGFRRRLSESVGYGRQIIKSEKQNFTAEIGVGARQTEPTIGDDVNETIGRGNLAYSYVLAEGAKFSQTLLVESGEESTYGQSVTSLAMPLIKNVSIKLAYTVKHNSVVTAGKKHSDSYTTINVGYSF
jgi:putative salt-induced outer membrane protein